MDEQATEDMSPDQLLNNIACLEPSSMQDMERGEGEMVNLDYQELYRSPQISNYSSTPSYLPTMAESGLNEYISYYSAMETSSMCGIKPVYQGEQGANQAGDLDFRGRMESELINLGDMTQNKDIISSSLRNIQDAIVTTNISASSRGLIEKSLHILRTAIAIGSQEKEEEVHLDGMSRDLVGNNFDTDLVGNNLDGLEAVGSLPPSALAVDEEAVREALGLHKVIVIYFWLCDRMKSLKMIGVGLRTVECGGS